MYLKSNYTLFSIVLLTVFCTKDPVDTGEGPDPLPNPTTVADVDGNVYRTIRIGNQIWTAENLRTTRYNDGTTILFDTSNATWANGKNAAFCFCRNATDPDTIKKYGALYNWYAVDTKKLAPAGWHVPDTTEWNTLQHYLIANGYNWDGSTDSNKIAKSMASKTDWNISTIAGSVGNDLNKNNRSGFSAFPCGFRVNGGFSSFGYACQWWSATPDSNSAWFRMLNSQISFLARNIEFRSTGFSVRLVMN